MVVQPSQRLVWVRIKAKKHLAHQQLVEIQLKSREEAPALVMPLQKTKEPGYRSPEF